MHVGSIYRHADFYVSADTGESLAKFLIVLALPPGGDVVLRVLTSRHAHARPAGCHHGAPYPGFALGAPGGQLAQPTWVDLRAQDDYDVDVFRGRLSRGVISEALRLDGVLLRALLACAASADDTSREQARHIRDAMAAVTS